MTNKIDNNIINAYTNNGIYTFKSMVELTMFFDKNPNIILHRDDGYAIESNNNSSSFKYYFLNGKKFNNEKQFQKELLKLKIDLF